MLSELLNSGAEFGYDFNERTAIEMAAEQIIGDTPGYQLRNTRAALEFANLTSPVNILSSLNPLLLQPDLPVPRKVLTKLGGGLRNALRFAARAQCLFDDEMFELPDPDVFPSFYAPGFGARLAEMRMRTALATQRVFDKEDNNSVEVLNETADWMSNAIAGPPTLRPLIRELDSAVIDAIQAADVAAGMARDIIDRSGVRGLVDKFRRVLVNGIDLRTLIRQS